MHHIMREKGSKNHLRLQKQGPLYRKVKCNSTSCDFRTDGLEVFAERWVALGDAGGFADLA